MAILFSCKPGNIRLGRVCCGSCGSIRSNPRGGSACCGNPCSMCFGLVCADTCCECFGGDLISCI